MAMCLIFSCQSCDYQVEGWDEGNPYIETDGERIYFYHPEPFPDPPKTDAEALFGNAPDHVCLDCGETRKLDPDRDAMVCARCGGSKLTNAFEMAGQRCPKCGGTMNDGELGGIS